MCAVALRTKTGSLVFQRSKARNCTSSKVGGSVITVRRADGRGAGLAPGTVGIISFKRECRASEASASIPFRYFCSSAGLMSYEYGRGSGPLASEMAGIVSLVFLASDFVSSLVTGFGITVTGRLGTPADAPTWGC